MIDAKEHWTSEFAQWDLNDSIHLVLYQCGYTDFHKE